MQRNYTNEIIKLVLLQNFKRESMMNVMKKIFGIAIILFTCNLNIFAQTAKELESNLRRRNEIMQEPEKYYWAQGNGESYDEAYDIAKQRLASQIYSRIESQSSDKVQYKSVNGDFIEESSFTSDFKSTTKINLHGHQTLTIDLPNKKNKEYTVFVFIDKKKAENLVAEQEKADEEEARRLAEAEKEEARQREEKLNNDIYFYYTQGMNSLSKLRIGYALKFFYSGYIISSDTHATIEKDGDVQPADAVFTQLLDETLDNIKVICEVDEDPDKSDKRQTIFMKQLGFYYQGNDQVLRKLDGLDFKYFDGNRFISGARVRDGKSTAELRRDLKKFELSCIYAIDNNELDPQVRNALENKSIKPLSLSSADKTILCHQESISVEVNGVEAIFEEETNPVESVIEQDASRFDALTDIMIDIENAIRSKNYNSVKPYFTENGLDCFDKLICYGNASIIEVPTRYDFIDFGDLIICRSITMEFKFKNNKKFVENVTFRFNRDNQVESLAFTLTDIAQHDIMDNEDWSRDSKITLLAFMEDYQTAYALRRIDYLEQIFSDNALIIVGNKLIQKDDGDGIRYRSKTHLDTLSKSQYMTRLRRHFETKEYINLNFTETEFTQDSRGNNIFGVRLRQEYFSSNYGDVGYLFLMVDLRKDVPVIHVRAWQEGKLPLNQLISLKNFRY